MCRVPFSFLILSVLLPSVCLIFLHWFPPLIYFSLVLPVSRDWVTAIICLNSHLQIFLFWIHFLTCSWFNFLESSCLGLWCFALYYWGLSDYHSVAFNTVQWISLSFSMTSQSTSTDSFPHLQFASSSLLASFLLLIFILSSGALSVDSLWHLLSHP